VFVEGEVDDGFAEAFAVACRAFAAFNLCDDIGLSFVWPESWRATLMRDCAAR
jgi:hypothetical protein